MRDDGVRIKAAICDYGDHIGIAIGQRGEDGRWEKMALPLRMEPVGGNFLQEALSLSQEAAQVLMDDLWHIGIRPTSGKGSAGQLAAVSHHLGDMRAIVENKLKVKLP